MEEIDHVEITLAAGVAGDFRGAMRNGPYKRQVTLLEHGDWETATALVGVPLPWWSRRANLLVHDFDLPQVPGMRIRIGADVVLQITRETDPCERMDVLAKGLKAALIPDWRGGACSMVIAGGSIAIGDEIRIET